MHTCVYICANIRACPFSCGYVHTCTYTLTFICMPLIAPSPALATGKVCKYMCTTPHAAGEVYIHMYIRVQHLITHLKTCVRLMFKPGLGLLFISDGFAPLIPSPPSPPPLSLSLLSGCPSHCRWYVWDVWTWCERCNRLRPAVDVVMKVAHHSALPGPHGGRAMDIQQ